MDRDVIMIRPDPFTKDEEMVVIEGSVYYPGRYVITSKSEKVTDIIARAGGLMADSNPDASELLRNGEKIQLSFKSLIRNPRSRHNFSIVNNDTIKIGYFTKLVTISGEVNNPGNYQYIKGKKINDYIEMAGDYTKKASKYATFVVYPNGTSKSIKFLKSSPAIIDGSKIIVGRKEDVEPFSITEYVSNITQIYADLSQAYLLILLARQN